LDVDTSNWLNFRRLDFVPISGMIPFPRSVGSHQGVDVDASSRCLRSPLGSGYACKPRLVSGHIATTFEAKESGAPGGLAQSLSISRRLE